MASQYARGVALERQAALILSARGFWVARAAGSHGVADLIALHPLLRPWLVQCKVHLRNMSPGEWAELVSAADRLNCVAVVVDRSGLRESPAFYYVTGARPHRAPAGDYLRHVDWDVYA
jgi:Holliday junction resolvase